MKNFGPISNNVAKKCGRLDGFAAKAEVPMTVRRLIGLSKLSCVYHG